MESLEGKWMLRFVFDPHMLLHPLLLASALCTTFAHRITPSLVMPASLHLPRKVAAMLLPFLVLSVPVVSYLLGVL